MSSSSAEHREKAKGRRAGCAVLTVSDTRTKETDRSGRIIVEALEAAGHLVRAYEIVKDEVPRIEPQLRGWAADPVVDAIFTTGGTGISTRDTTIEVVDKMLTKRLDGFGELFRMLSWEEIGAAAMLTRAVGGLSGETVMFALPGSASAVRLAMEKLIIPELPHLVWERDK